MGLVDEAVDLVERRHHVQEQDGKRQDVSVLDPAMHEQVDSEGNHEQVEETLIERLPAAEQRHLEVVPDLLDPALLGGFGHAANLLGVCVRSADVVESAELLDDRAVHLLATAQESQPYTLL